MYTVWFYKYLQPAKFVVTLISSGQVWRPRESRYNYSVLLVKYFLYFTEFKFRYAILLPDIPTLQIYFLVINSKVEVRFPFPPKNLSAQVYTTMPLPNQKWITSTSINLNGIISLVTKWTAMYAYDWKCWRPRKDTTGVYLAPLSRWFGLGKQALVLGHIVLASSKSKESWSSC